MMKATPQPLDSPLLRKSPGWLAHEQRGLVEPHHRKLGLPANRSLSPFRGEKCRAGRWKNPP